MEATFSPLRDDDLRPDGQGHVGWRGRWQCLGTIEDRLSPYRGQRLWWVVEGERWFGWVPDEDLVDVADVHDLVPLG